MYTYYKYYYKYIYNHMHVPHDIDLRKPCHDNRDQPISGSQIESGQVPTSY